MKQELFIGSDVVSYVLQTKNITAVLGHPWIYRSPSRSEVLRIVFLGLSDTKGLSEAEFVGGYGTGYVSFRRRRGQYALWMIYGLLRKRICEINKEGVMS